MDHRAHMNSDPCSRYQGLETNIWIVACYKYVTKTQDAMSHYYFFVMSRYYICDEILHTYILTTCRALK